MSNPVFMQKWRLFFATLRLAYKSSIYVESHPDVAIAYFGLLSLYDLAYKSIQANMQDEFIAQVLDLSDEDFQFTVLNEGLDTKAQMVKTK